MAGNIGGKLIWCLAVETKKCTILVLPNLISYDDSYDIKFGKRSSKQLCFQGRKGSSAHGCDTVYTIKTQYLIPLTKNLWFSHKTAQYISRQYYPPYGSYNFCFYFFLFISIKASHILGEHILPTKYMYVLFLCIFWMYSSHVVY